MKQVTSLSMLLLFVFTVLQISCTEQTGSNDANHDGYIINGQIANAKADTRIFLDEVLGDKVNVIDTAILDENGSFKMKGKVAQKGLGRLRIGLGRNAVMLMLDNDKMELNADIKNLKDYTITGSPESMQVRDLLVKVQSRQASPKYLQSYVDTVKSPLLAYLASNYLPIENHYDTYKKVAQKMQKAYPNSQLTRSLNTKISKAKGLLATAVGSPAPEIQLPSPAGKEIPLSSLKGNVVLIDFWASWCRPCRRENPNVVRAYNKYKEKGFEVYSVSLDRSKEKWKQAIAKDGLIWDGHVSDLAGWQSGAAALYGVKSIPQTILVDKNGNIVAKNLRGAALEKKLEELLGKA